MKKYESILKRVEAMEKKQGLIYATSDGSAFKNLRLCLYLVYIYKLVMDLIYISGKVFMYFDAGQEIDKIVLSGISISAAALVIGRIFLYLKNKWFKAVGLCLFIATLPVELYLYSTIMRDGTEIRKAFYWMHLAPAVLIFIISAVLLVIILRAVYLKNKHYKIIVSNLYEACRQKNGVIENPESLDEAAWEAFLETYNPEIYKNQF